MATASHIDTEASLNHGPQTVCAAVAGRTSMRLLPGSRQRRGRVNALAGSSTTGVAGSTPWPAARPRPRTGCPGERGPTLERATSGATENAASPTAAPAGKRAARHERVSRAVIAPRESRGGAPSRLPASGKAGGGGGEGPPRHAGASIVAP